MMNLYGLVGDVSNALIQQGQSIHKSVVDTYNSTSTQTLVKCALLGGVALGTGLLAYNYYTQGAASEGSLPTPPPVNICTMPEYASICEGNMGIPRLDMPQILGSVKDYFLGNYSASGVNVYDISMEASNLTPIQAEMNTGKILGMIDAFKAGKFNPCADSIMVAGNGALGSPIHVIDGHHRFAACSILEMPISVTLIETTASAVLDYAKSFPGVFSAAL